MINKEDAGKRPRVIGYLRGSTAAQEYTIEAQESALSVEADREGWDIEWFEEDPKSAKNMRRPMLQEGLTLLTIGKFDGLAVSRLDRLSRSLADAAGLIERAAKEDWSLISLQPRIDMSTAYGKAMAGMAAVFSQLERDIIAERTKEGLAVARSRGVVLGRQRLILPYAEERIVELHGKGWGLRKIAGQLTNEGVPTPMGGKTWGASTVGRVVSRNPSARDR